MLRHPVKASAITHLTDARYFAAWEVEYLGFDLSPAGVSAVELAALREWIIGPKLVGELDAGWPERGENPADLKQLGLDALQVDTAFGLDAIRELLRPLGLPIFLELVVEGYADPMDLIHTINDCRKVVDHLLLNFTKGGIEWGDLGDNTPLGLDVLDPISEDHSLWLEIEGAAPGKIIQELPDLVGLSVRGGSEEKVGFKDFDDLDEFFESLVVED